MMDKRSKRERLLDRICDAIQLTILIDVYEKCVGNGYTVMRETEQLALMDIEREHGGI